MSEGIMALRDNVYATIMSGHADYTGIKIVERPIEKAHRDDAPEFWGQLLRLQSQGVFPDAVQIAVGNCGKGFVSVLSNNHAAVR